MNKLTAINILILILALNCRGNAEDINSINPEAIKGLTGQINNVRICEPAATKIKMLKKSNIPQDINLKRMAQWAMNYLINTPRKELNYEPVFQCHPLRCPPAPIGHDPVVACDTESRMDWE
jgi:hypothetical protein